MDNRALLGARAALMISALLLASPVFGQVEPAIRIGVAAPLSGPSALLGAQILAGASQATAGQADVAIVEADTECTAEGGRRAATRLIEAKVEIVAGFLCTEALETALPALTGAGIPVVAVGVRANRFTDNRTKSDALVWRIGPRSDAAADAVARLLTVKWRDVPFGLVDDGTIYGRGLSDMVRARLEADGLRPATIDNYRPAEEKQFGLARRILATGVTRLFIAGDRPDIAIIARDAAELGLPLEIVGGESLLDEPGGAVLPSGVLAVAQQDRFDEIEGGTTLPEDETRRGYFGPAYAATQIAIDAVRRKGAAGATLRDILDGSSFLTVLGPLRFDAKGDSNLDLFRVFRFDGRDFVTETGG